MCIFIRGERTIIRFLIGVISALVIGGIIISIPSTVRIVTGQSSALPTSVILEVPSGSEFNQSRPDLPPVAIYQLEHGSKGHSPKMPASSVKQVNRRIPNLSF